MQILFTIKKILFTKIEYFPKKLGIMSKNSVLIILMIEVNI